MTVRLVRGDKRSIRIPFLVDSGAAMSIVSQVYVGSLITDLSAVPAQDTGAKDSNNGPVKGKWVDFDIELQGLSAPLRERVLVQEAGSHWGLLGQTWFEQVGARFENFVHGPKKRGFALYPCPWPPPR
ncbi:MAG: hypothetical protein ACMG6S_09635 [Byssovorax sp.]